MSPDIINILNLKPNEVQSCYLNVENKVVTYRVTLIKTFTLCPNCLSKLVFKDYRPIKINHNIIIGRKTVIIFNRRRYYCPNCKTYHYETSPIPSENRFTGESIYEIMNFIREHSATFSMTARVFKTSPTKIVQLFDEYGQIPPGTLPECICIDEFQWKHKGKNQYAAVIYDFCNDEIIDILEGRTKVVWNNYLQIRKDQTNNVKYIVSDMFETYRSVKSIHFPNAQYAIDSFHVVKNINELLNQYRINLMRTYEKNSVEYYLLKKFSWLLLYDSVNIKENKAKYNKKLKRYINYPQLLEEMLKIDDQLKEAYELKEGYLLFNQTTTLENARVDLAEQIVEFQKSSIPSFQNFSNTLISFFDEIVNSFVIIEKKRLSNGKIESLNSRIKIILKNACGYTNFRRMRNRIMFTLNDNVHMTILSDDKKEIIQRQFPKRDSYNKNKKIKRHKHKKQ